MVQDALDALLDNGDELEERDWPAPLAVVETNYKLHFGLNKNLSATQGCKLVEARMHNNDRRVTLLYPGLGSFTFEMSQDMPLTQKSEWHCKYRKESYNLLM